MALLFKWLARALTALAALAVFAFGIAYYLASHSLPDYDADYAVDGLNAPLEIVRDNYAIPHITGKSDRDVLFGLGFAHAQDRLFQMTLMRRTVQGRLSEVFGEDTYGVDVLLRALDLYGISTRTAELQSDEVKAELEAYSDGVNAYITLIREEALGRGAPEFFLFSNQIAPWTPADSVAILKLMALQLSDQAATEVLRAKLSLRLSPERLADIMPLPPEAVIDLPDFASIDWPDRDFAAMPPPHPLSPIRPVGLAGASNAWAAGPERSAAGASLLATDPHLGLTAPSIWYLAQLDLEETRAIGGTIPGIPGILVGRNDAIGWGLTSSYLDDQDIYIEKLNPDDPTEYLTPEGYSQFRIKPVVISIKDQPARTETLRWTRHGPVIPMGHFGADQITPQGHVAALSWTAFEEDDKTIGATLGLMRAATIPQARELTRQFVSPSTNLVIADRNEIALQTMGRVPKRQAGHNSRGQIPAAGWAAVNDWQGYLPWESNPKAINPAGGIVVNTNNRLVDRPFPEHFSYHWGDTHRIERAKRLLNGREFHTLDSFIEAQTDTVSEAARSVVSLIGKDLWFTGEPAAQGTRERLRQTALEAMAAWNGEMSEHQPEPLIYAAWARALQRRLIIDDLGPLATKLSDPDPLFLERVFRDTDGAGIWCDIRTSTEIETCQDAARLALDEALLELTETYGGRLEGWRWGVAHQALHRHEVLGRIPVLQWIFNIRQDTPGGDNTLLRGKTDPGSDEPYLNVHAGGFRGVFDFADPDASVFIIATGQSGHFLSRHYDDMSLLWRRSEYIPMSLDPELARGGSVGITSLTPRP